MTNFIDDRIRKDFLEKFSQHEIHFEETRHFLNEFDRNLTNFNEILQRLKNSTIEIPTDEIERRLLQISTKREEIRSTKKLFDDLIDALKTNLSKKCPSKHRNRSDLLRQHLLKLLDQQKQNEEILNRIQIRKAPVDHHAEQIAEFQQLNEEFSNLSEENRLLKRQAKEKTQRLYDFINESFRT